MLVMEFPFVFPIGASFDQRGLELPRLVGIKPLLMLV